MKMLILALAAVGLVGCATPEPASAGLVDVSVVNRATGEHLKVYSRDGNLYVAGRPGDRYAIRMHNRSGGRVLTVVSVDGVNVVTGQTASPHQGGYVLSAHESHEITGWRKSLDQVAAFYFTALPDSYAARTGRPGNVGVIGVAVFSERVERPTVSLSKSRAADAPSPAAESSSMGAASAPMRRLRDERIGTGHGERENSRVTTTEFRRDSRSPAQVITIYYDSYHNLAARGIIPTYPAKRPNAFPGHFVPDPHG
ncbi:MAG: hypothetical protein AABZ50_00205 [Pseudomonadota bacterium]